MNIPDDKYWHDTPDEEEDADEEDPGQDFLDRDERRFEERGDR